MNEIYLKVVKESMFTLLNGFFNFLKSEIFISQFAATVGALVVVFLSNTINEVYFEPRKEFDILRRKIAVALVNEARYYSNPCDVNATEKEKEAYIRSSEVIRRLASELQGFMVLHKKFRTKKIKNIDIKHAYAELIGLSNIYFMSSKIRYSSTLDKLPEEIENLLKLK